jgi:uncharacterized protein YmfQ (DUF2313 family)
VASEQQIQRWAEGVLSLLARGAAWRPTPGGVLARILEAVGAEWLRVAERLDRLPLEGDPRTSIEMLPEWEATLGLPSPCTPGPLTTPIQQMNAAARYAGRPGPATAAEFVAFAASLGYVIEIEEVDPFVGDLAEADDGAWSEQGVFWWFVHAPTFTVVFAEAGVSCAGDTLGDWSNELLECEITPRRPAHTHVQFIYDLPIQPQDYQPWPPFVQLVSPGVRAVAVTGAVAV